MSSMADDNCLSCLALANPKIRPITDPVVSVMESIIPRELCLWLPTINSYFSLILFAFERVLYIFLVALIDFMPSTISLNLKICVKMLSIGVDEAVINIVNSLSSERNVNLLIVKVTATVTRKSAGG